MALRSGPLALRNVFTRCRCGSTASFGSGGIIDVDVLPTFFVGVVVRTDCVTYTTDGIDGRNLVAIDWIVRWSNTSFVNSTFCSSRLWYLKTFTRRCRPFETTFELYVFVLLVVIRWIIDKAVIRLIDCCSNELSLRLIGVDLCTRKYPPRFYCFFQFIYRAIVFYYVQVICDTMTSSDR